LGLPNRPLVIGHQGWAGAFPGNTLLSIGLACRLGVDAVAIDVMETSDGELVLSHEERLDRFTNRRGVVRDWTAVELFDLDAAYWFTRDGGRSFPWRGRGVRIPPLDKALGVIDKPVVYLNLKTASPNGLDRLIELIQRHGMARRAVLCSFSAQAIDYARRKRPDFVIAAHAAEVQRTFAIAKLGLEKRIKPRKASAWHVPERRHGIRILTPELLRAAGNLGVGVVVQAVNQVRDMRRLLDLGVHGIVTGHPERLMPIVFERGPASRARQAGAPC
jgi:glycerophosphoryl diester phosphodiesterase